MRACLIALKYPILSLHIGFILRFINCFVKQPFIHVVSFKYKRKLPMARHLTNTNLAISLNVQSAQAVSTTHLRPIFSVSLNIFLAVILYHW